MRAFLTTALAGVLACQAADIVFAQDHEVSQATRQLEQGKAEEKSAAARTLGDFGPAAATAVPALVQALQSSDASLKYESAIALGRIGANAKQSVPALSQALSDSHVGTRYASIDALRQFGTDARASLPQLKKLQSDKDPLISVSAARATVEIAGGRGQDAQDATAALIAGLKNSHPEVVGESVQGLALIGPAAIPSIEKVVASGSDPASSNACDALAAMGPASAAAISTLQTAAASKEANLRWHAIGALGELGPAAKPAIPVLISALEESDPKIRFTAEQSLARIGSVAIPALIDGLKSEKSQSLVLPVITQLGPEAAPATTKLTELLSSTDGITQRQVVLALAAIGPQAKSAAPQLIQSLKNKQFAFRPAAAFALGKLEAIDAVEALKAATKEQDQPLLHLAGTWALLQIDPANDENVKAAIPELTTALSNENPEIRREAALALGQIGPRAATAVGKLQPLLKDKSPAVKVESLVALAEIGSASQPAVADIDSLLTDADPGIRPIACYALGRIGAPAKSSVPKLQKMLSSRIPHERTIAAWSLVQIHPEPETVKVAIPLLADAIHGARNPNVRIQAAEALGKVGSGSSVAKDALQTAANDADPAVKKAATEALAKLK